MTTPITGDQLRAIVEGMRTIYEFASAELQTKLQSNVNTIDDTLVKLQSTIIKPILAAHDSARQAKIRADEAAEMYGLTETQALRSILSAVENEYTRYLNDVAATSILTLNRARGSLLGSVATVAGELGRLNETVTEELDKQFLSAIQNLNNVYAEALTEISYDAQTTADQIKEVDDKVNIDLFQILKDSINPISATLSVARKAIFGEYAPLIEGIGFLGKVLKDDVNKTASPILEPIWQMVEGFLDNQSLIAQGGLTDEQKQEREIEFTRSISPDLLSQATRSVFGEGALPALLAGFAAPIVIPLVTVTLVNALIGGFITKISQAGLRWTVPTLHTLADYHNLHNAGMISDEDKIFGMESQGYSEKKITELTELLSRWGSVDDLITQRRYEKITQEEFDHRLALQGYPEQARSLFEDLIYAPPNVQQLILFAVREVFRPEIVQKFELDKNFPQSLVEITKLQGVDEFWLRKYWQAHWQLPSRGVGNDAFHRVYMEPTLDPDGNNVSDPVELIDGSIRYKLIGQDTYRELLEVQDTMPWWVPIIEKVNYRPTTRVDIRRLYQSGVFTLADVEAAYLDVGYSPTTARQLTEFTRDQYGQEQKQSTKRERDLTRSDVQGAFADGLITDTDLTNNLLKMGYDEDETKLIVDRAVLKLNLKNLKAVLKSIKSSAKKGLITSDQALSQMAKLGFPDQVIEQQRIELTTIEQEEETTIPTIAQATAFAKAGMLTRDEYGAALKALNIAPAWVPYFVAQRFDLKPPEENIDIQAKIFIDLYIEGVIPRDRIEEKLLTLGYPSEQIEKLIIQGIDVKEAQELEDEEEEPEGEEI